MPERKHHPLLTGAAVTSLGTLLSRILGLVRDSVTASLFGLTTGGVLDALTIAFRIPNLFRALFGEGALTASFMPVFTSALDHKRADARRLYARVMAWLMKVLLVITLLGEIVFGVWAWLARDTPQGLMLAGLSAALLPLLILVCVAAIASATLQAVGRFAAPAFAPAVLNLCWILGAAILAPRWSDDPVTQAYLLAVCILIGGALQWIVQWPALRREGFRWRAQQIYSVYERNLLVGATDDSKSEEQLRQIRRGMLPVMLALTVTQLNTLSDSVVAWLLAAPRDSVQTIHWLGDIVYPMQEGAVAAIYFGERLYQFPLGLIGIAAATSIFPLLSQHANRSDLDAVADDLTLGLRLVLLLAVPSAVGLVMLAEPIARLMFQHGRFTDADTLRTARMIAIYGAGVWAYCSLPVLVRGFYAMNDRIGPLRIALAAVALNLVLDFTLIWPLAEAGLAVATATAAAVQLAALAISFSHGHVSLRWRKLGATILRTIVASAAMAVVGVATLRFISPTASNWNAFWRVVIPLATSSAVYLAVIAAIGRADWRELLSHRSE
jgi:putative peptidoglycan lipid II flippase